MHLLGVLTELQRVTISFAMSVCLSAWNNSASTGQIFVNLIFEYFSNICWGNLNFVKNWTRIMGTWHETNIYFIIISRSFLPRMKNVSDKSSRGNRNTQATITIWHMPIACWITKATHTHWGCVILTAFPLQQWLQECASLLHYVYIAHLIGVTKDLTF